MKTTELGSEHEGTLYLCPTPIGNLGDITLRVIDTLKQADLICAEDTRRTGRLLQHLGIDKPLWSFHEHNESVRIQAVLERLQAGQNVALVSDAGVPGIADPGYTLVRAARERNLDVVSLPGPSAFLTALVGSGLPTDRFVFLGFAPRRSNERKRFLAQYQSFPHTRILYESPHRLRILLQDLARIWGEGCKAVLVKELTKMFEEWYFGTLRELAEHDAVKNPKGEWVVLVEGSEANASVDMGEPVALIGLSGESDHERLERARANMLELMREGLSPAAAARAAASTWKVPRRVVYQAYLDQNEGSSMSGNE